MSQRAHLGSHQDAPYALDNQDAILVQALTSPISAILIIAVLAYLIVVLAKRRCLHATEYAVTAAVLLESGIWAESLVLVSDSTGVLPTPISPNGLQKTLKVFFAWTINYHLAKAAAEAAVLFMLKDVFGLKSRRWRYAWMVALVLTVLAGVAAAIMDLARCDPVRRNWDATAPGSCLDGQTIFATTNAVVGAASVIILTLAFFLIVCDAVKWKHKALVLFYWILGLLLIVLCFPSIISQGPNDAVLDDFISSLPPIFTISVWEVSIGIIFATIPTLVLVLRKSTSDKQNRDVEEGRVPQQGDAAERGNTTYEENATVDERTTQESAPQQAGALQEEGVARDQDTSQVIGIAH